MVFFIDRNLALPFYPSGAFLPLPWAKSDKEACQLFLFQWRFLLSFVLREKKKSENVKSNVSSNLDIIAF
jgi:hypothetical protein